MRITAENSIGLVIDMQERLFAVMYDKESLLFNCKKLIDGMKIFNLPMMLTQQYTKGLGQTLPSLCVDCHPIEKTSFSCYKNHEFKSDLHQLQKRNIIICGIEAHICVLQTALDLKEMGFNPIVVVDCISSRRPYDKEIAVMRMRQEEIMITTYESALFELCKDATSEHFKEIAQLVK